MAGKDQYRGKSDAEVLNELVTGDSADEPGETGEEFQGQNGFRWRGRADGSYEAAKALLAGRIIWRGSRPPEEDEYYD